MLKGLEQVVIVSGHEGHARMDRLAAGNAGAVGVQIFSSGLMALEFLADNQADVVVCDDQLGDMSGREFISQLRSDPLLSLLPVLAASPGSGEVDVLEALEAGCSGYLVRPYSQEAFERQVRQAMQSSEYPGQKALLLAKARARRRQEGIVRKARAETTHSVPEVRELNPARRHYKLGQRYYLSRAYRIAAGEFRKAIAVNHVYAEAFEGLARACLGLRDEKGYARHMQRAMELYADQERFLEARHVFMELREAREFPVNPFYEKGVTQWKEGDCPEAILSWRRAVKLTPESDRVVTCLAWGYNIIGRREDAVEFLQETLAREPGLPKAEHLLQHLLGGKSEARSRASLRSVMSRGLNGLRRVVGSETAESAA